MCISLIKIVKSGRKIKNLESNTLLLFLIPDLILEPIKIKTRKTKT